LHPFDPVIPANNKVLDTDAQEFSGNGHQWVNEYATEPRPAFHHPHSFCAPLLPLHGMLFRLVARAG
jgi:hypothetical protein